MRRFLTTFLLLCVSAVLLQAQTYEKLWAQTDDAVRKDLPRTALTLVGNIYEKARADRDEVQMLRSLLYACRLQGEISPDSIGPARTRIFDVFRSGTESAEGSRFTPGLWLSALAQTYARPGYYRSVPADTADLRRAVGFYAASLSPETFGQLAALSAKDYAPLLVEGADSRYFGHDLLNVLARAYVQSQAIPVSGNASAVPGAAGTGPGETKIGIGKTISILGKTVPILGKTEMLGLLIRHYLAAGNRDAALLLTLDSIALQEEWSDDVTAGSRYRALTRTAQDYADLPLNVETYIALTGLDRYGEEDTATDSLFVSIARQGIGRYGRQPRAAALRNYLAGKEEPALRLELPDGVLYPGREYRVGVSGRNVARAELRLTRLGLTAAGYGKFRGDFKALAAKKKGAARTFALTPPERPAYAWWHDSLRVTAPEEGIYLCELYASGRRLDQAVVNVSRIRSLVLNMPDGNSRVVLLDAMSGTPVGKGRIVAYADDMRQQAVHEVGADGSVVLQPGDGRHYRSYYPEVGTDAFAPAFFLSRSGGYGYRNDTLPVVSLDIFPDRAIYRPGQQVRFGGTAYSRRGDVHAAMSGQALRVALLDVNRKQVDSLRLATDDFGNFGGVLRLPATCLPGRFTIEVSSAATTRGAYVRVEEYKRPTFSVESEEVKRAYALGDTVDVSAVARTYTDLPVEGARVRWRVTKNAWFRAEGNGSPQSGESVTDAAGRFVVPVVLEATPAERAYRPYNCFYYTLSFDVTADNGETASGSCVLRAATRASWLQADWPAAVCKERLPRVTIRQTNADGKDIPAEGRYRVCAAGRVRAEGTYRTGEAFMPDALAGLPSGAYRVVYEVAGNTGAVSLPGGKERADAVCDSTELLLFSETDVRPAAKADLWQHVRMSARQDTAYVMAGTSCEDVTLFYDLFAGRKLVESRRIAVSDSLLRFTIAYRPEFGDGARACFAFVKDGRLHEFSTEIRKPVPDKRLRLRWSSFRSRLTPGQDEEWRLTVTLPDGRPADAVVTARLYDASLDALATSRWAFGGIDFPRAVPFARWSLSRAYGPMLSGTVTAKRTDCRPLSFTHWDEKLFGSGMLWIRGTGNVRRALAGRVYGLSEMKMQLKMSAAEDGAKAESEAVSADVAAPMANALSAGKAVREAVATDDAGAAAVEPRTNFVETAYFHPALRTDDNGTAVIAFTLPQSLTTWNFNALAHTREMDYGAMDTAVVARKEFMVQPALPRFVRRGDRTELPVTLRNLSDRDVEVTLRCLLTDARTGAEVGKMSKKVRLAAGKSHAVAFGYDVDAAGPLLVCRMTAAGDGFSDGEEHYLPVLSDLVSVTRTLPFAMTEKGRRTLRVDTLWQSKSATDRRLTVETAGNPRWYAVAALPVLARGNCHGASDWATRYYALSLGDYVARMNPELSETLCRDTAAVAGLSAHMARFAELAEETPWLREAEGEAERAAALQSLFDADASAARKFTALDNLRALQHPDGSWSWYKGMPANAFVTVDVAVLLARAARFAGDADAAACLKRALGYLGKEMARQVVQMKREEKKHVRRPVPSELQLRYLYLRSLMGLQPDKDAAYLIEGAEKLCHELTMYGKALTAVVLFDAGRTDAAQENLNSLLEHTVSTPDMGMYFDTDRAQWSWNAYRIPTQTAAIEALLRMRPSSNAEVARMRLWLMQSKRTQAWETSRATADAVYALLAHSPLDSTLGALNGGSPLFYTLDKGRKVVGLNAPSQAEAARTVNYTKQTYDEAPAVDADAVTLSKATDGLSWGSVYATFTLPAAAVAADGKGFVLARRFEVRRGDVWTPLRDGDAVRRGDRVRQVFTLTAARDYDFVALKSSRPACLEPARPLSGYAWQDGMGSYRVVRDASTEYFFEQVRKGTHVFTEECLADRAGTYQCGLATVECVYAPEFRAQTAGFVLKVAAE